MLLGDLVEVWLGEEQVLGLGLQSAGLPLAAQELLGLCQQLLLQARRLSGASFEF